MTIIWCMVPEILSVTDRIFCHFGPFFLHFFNPLTTQKIKILKIKKKTPRDIIILHMCTKNHDLMLYCSWGMVRDGCNYFFSFWTFFLPFYPPPPTPYPPPKISKKWNKCLEMSSFYTSVPKIMIIWYTVPEIWHMTDVIVIFHFGLFFALLPS